MAYIFHNAVLHSVLVWPMANIMQQDGYIYSLFFFLSNDQTFSSEGFYCHSHQMHRPDSMVKPCMNSPRINKVCHPHLLYISKPLKVGVLN